MRETPFMRESFNGERVMTMGRAARRSTTAKDGVVNGWNPSWDEPTLFTTDGPAMARSVGQNPSITSKALTARAVAHAVGELNRRAL
ncbi:MAG: hypothetical protein ACOVSI_12690 [Gemmatimonas sp.]